jgi:DNA-binding MarR family transcriptional regulator
MDTNAQKNTLHCVIFDWMFSEMGLTGNEALAYSIIHHFSINGGNYYGSMNYMANFLGISKTTVWSILKKLEAKGFIAKTGYADNGMKLCEYTALVLHAKSPLGSQRHCVVFDWMLKDMGLSRNQALVYAIIYHFSLGDTWFRRSLKYLSDFIKISKQALMALLKQLESKGYITKVQKTVNNVLVCEYKATFTNPASHRAGSALPIQETKPAAKKLDNPETLTVGKELNPRRQETQPAVGKNPNPGRQETVPNNNLIKTDDKNNDSNGGFPLYPPKGDNAPKATPAPALTAANACDPTALPCQESPASSLTGSTTPKNGTATAVGESGFFFPPKDSERQKHKTKARAYRDFDALDYILGFGVDMQVAMDFLTHRKAIKATVTQTVIDRIAAKATKYGHTLEDALALVCENGWRGYYAPEERKPFFKAKPSHFDMNMATAKAARQAILDGSIWRTANHD